MNIYVLFMLITLISYPFTIRGYLLTENKALLSNRSYCFLLSMLLFAISALRGLSVGNDTGQYAWHFYNTSSMSFQQILQFHLNEPLFYLLTKIVSLISNNHQVLFAMVAAFYSFSIYRLIYKYSKQYLVSYFMLIPMMYFAFSLTGLRQTLAISVLLLSIDYIVDRKIVLFFFSVGIAFLFHNSAVFFIPAYFLYTKKLYKIRVLLFFIISPILFFSRYFILTIVQRFFYTEYSLGGYSGGWTTLFVYFVIILVSTLFRKQMMAVDSNFPFFYSMMFVGFWVQMFVPIQPNIFRVSMYYNISSILLLPGLIKTQNDSFSKIIAYSIFFILMIVQYFFFTYNAAGVNPYRFFWQ